VAYGFQLPAYGGPAASGSFLDSGTSLDMGKLLDFGGSSGGNGDGIRAGAQNSLVPDALVPKERTFMDGMLGDATSNGWGGLALKGLGGAAGLFMGMQQYGLAKDALAQAKDQYAKNYAAQRITTNAALSDRQNARVAASPTGYASTADYMSQYGIKA
jgi:hypothetical protein